ncbi:MAG: DinB family protein [Gemmatimonadales bacterium]
MPKLPIPLLTEAIQPAPGRSAWHGGPTPLGALRGVSAAQARWTPTPGRKSIWALTLHLTYWKYAVRRLLDGSGRGRFPRQPSNWPVPPEPADSRAWADDLALLRAEHEHLVRAAGLVTPSILQKRPPGSLRWTYGELLIGIATHDAYHTGQIQLMKRLWRERRLLKRGA